MAHEKLKDTVREAMKEILAEQRPMPVPASSDCVTEIIIRSGSAGAVQVLGAGCVPLPDCYACPTCVPLPQASMNLLQKIQSKTGEAQKDVISKLEFELRAKHLASAIEEYAQKVGVE